MRIHKSHSLASRQVCLWELIDRNDHIWASGSGTDGLTWKKCAAALSAFGRKGLSLTLLSPTVLTADHQYDQQHVYIILETWRDLKWVLDCETGTGSNLTGEQLETVKPNYGPECSCATGGHLAVVRGDLVKPVSLTLLIHLCCLA